MTTSFTTKTIQATPEQLAIQTSDASTLLITANAGAAKTTTLALRIAEGLARGMAVDSLLALTYTEPACEALRLALLKIGVAAVVVKKLPIFSFEQFAKNCLTAYEGSVPRQCLMPEALQDTVRAAAVKLDRPDADNTDFVETFLQTALYHKGCLAREQLFWDGDNITPESCDDRGLDFSALSLLHTFERLRCPPEKDLPSFRAPFDATYDLARFVADPEHADATDVLPNWPRHVQLLVVDELHDLNAAMFAITRALLQSNPGAFFCAVGDVDQVLHAQAGADARYLQTNEWAQQTARPITRLPLTASYRFSSAVAELAQQFANKPYASKAEHSSVVQTLTYTTALECVQQVVQTAQAWHTAKKKMDQLVILLRHSHQSVAIENALRGAGLAYTMRGLSSYVQRPEVLLVRVLLAIATRNFEAVQSPATRQRMVEELVACCRVELSFAMNENESQHARLQEAIRHVVAEPSALLPFFEGQILRNAEPKLAARLQQAITQAREHGLSAMLQALDMPRWANTLWVEKQRRLDALAHLQGLSDAAQQFGSVADFFADLNRAELAQDVGKTAVKALCIAGIAAVKGLEFEHVVLPFLEQDVFPSSERRAIVDEKNLFYVAMTRARSVLTLVASSHKQSSFLMQL